MRVSIDWQIVRLLNSDSDIYWSCGFIVSNIAIKFSESMEVKGIVRGYLGKIINQRKI